MHVGDDDGVDALPADPAIPLLAPCWDAQIPFAVPRSTG